LNPSLFLNIKGDDKMNVKKRGAVTFMCNMCGSEFPISELVIDEEEGAVCKDCYENQDMSRGGHVGK